MLYKTLRQKKVKKLLMVIVVFSVMFPKIKEVKTTQDTILTVFVKVG